MTGSPSSTVRASSPTVAEVIGARKVYDGLAALCDVDLAIHAGERLALVGHNGSGKSTLIKMLLGFVSPDAGQVRVLDRPPDAPDGARMRGRIAYLPERVAFDPQMTGREVLRFYARLKGADAQAAALDALLERVGLRPAADRRIAGYSKGMQQRLGLAQALIGDADIYLFDEPTTGLDPMARRWFFALVADLKKRGKAVVIASHVLTELERVADRIAMISNGRLFAVGSLEELRRQAGLPHRLVLTLPPGMLLRAERAFAGLDAEMTVESDTRLVLTFPPSLKTALLAPLARLMEESADIDFSFSAPGLDALYAALLEDAEAERNRENGDGGGAGASEGWVRVQNHDRT